MLSGGDPNLDSAKSNPARMSEDVLKLAQQGTILLEKHSGTTMGKLINVAGRHGCFRRESPRSACSAPGALPPQMAQDLDTATGGITAQQELLTGAPQNTEAIRRELQLASSRVAVL
ncbi:hypothetical protein ACU4GD_31620 [Cupriavidus basilensis]